MKIRGYFLANRTTSADDDTANKNRTRGIENCTAKDECVLVLVQRDTVLWWYWLPLKHDNNRTGAADWMTACLPRLLANPNCLEWHNLLLQNDDVCTPIHPQRVIKYPLRESLLVGSSLMMSPSCAIVLVLHYTTTTTSTARQHLAWCYDANKERRTVEGKDSTETLLRQD